MMEVSTARKKGELLSPVYDCLMVCKNVKDLSLLGEELLCTLTLYVGNQRATPEKLRLRNWSPRAPTSEEMGQRKEFRHGENLKISLAPPL